MRIFTVDAFTDRPFSGNPAGVCILDNEIPEELIQLIAREINYSETAFVFPQNDSYKIQWFTPKMEVNLCGHATLAAAHILYELQYCDSSESIEFISASGTLTVRKTGDKIELNFPRLFVDEIESNEIVEKAFDIRPLYIGKNDNRYLIEIESYEKLLSIQPDFELLKSDDLGRFIITVKSDLPKYDFISRYFAPGVGVPEDPVTGTAHCYLAPYWAKKLGKTKMYGFQASARSGCIECELAPDNRVFLRGNAVIMHEIFPLWK
ncbi:PhzF family phenazine biosynthesis protein [Prevotella sp. 10(H)]|uniref:PhzF family phenazine biosynthesis protein n=1 Tax=Prevotella sp. 10(H) TaxID=1158294 RepID=UPI0004A75255|nr:PhzF family phenazine biosynthesis protein [Prevotella sp. 10(H)]